MHIKENEANLNHNPSEQLNLFSETQNNHRPGPTRGQLNRTPAIVSVSPELVANNSTLLHDGGHHQSNNIPTYINRNHNVQEPVNRNRMSPIHSASTYFDSPTPSTNQDRRNSSHVISLSNENMLAPPSTVQPPDRDGLHARRLTAPFIKSRFVTDYKQCTLYSVQGILHVHCIVYNVHCSLYSVHCTLYTAVYIHT